MYYPYSWRPSARSSSQTRLVGLICAGLVLAGCQSFVEQPAPTPKASQTAQSRQPGAASPTWRRWPDQSGQSSRPTNAAEQPSETAVVKPESASPTVESSAKAESAPDRPLPTEASHPLSTEASHIEPAAGGDVSPKLELAQDDGWYLLWQVSDQESGDPTYRWRNDRLDELTSSADDVLAELRRALEGDGSLAAATAAIGLARLGETSQYDRLVEIIQNRRNSVPMRRAAVETLSLADSTAARPRLKELLSRYSRPAASEPSLYVSELHAELIRAWARHTSVPDDPSFVEALSSPAEVVLVETLQAWSASHAEALPDEVVAQIGHDLLRVRLAALQAVASCRYEPAFPDVLAAQRDHELQVRLEAIRTLGAIGNDQAREALKEILQREAEHPRVAAVAASAQAGDMATVYTAASDRSWRVRLAVANAVAQDPSSRGRQVARTLLDDHSVEVAARVISSLSDWPLDASVPLLLHAAEMQVARLRKDATAQLADRWDAASQLRKPLTKEQRHELIANLRQACQSEFAQGADAQPQSVPDRHLVADIEQQQAELTREQTVRVEAMLLEYLEANTEDEQLHLITGLTENGSALVAVCEELVFERQQPLDDRIYGTLLVTVDSHMATIEQLRADDVDQRRVAAEKLVASTAKQPLSKLALYRLAKLVTSEADVEVWRSVLNVIGDYDGEPARRIAHAAASHLSPDIRRRACQYMEARCVAEHAEVLLSLLGDTDVSVVRAAIRAVGRCGPLSDFGPLKQLLSSTDNTLRVEAAIALARVGSASGTAALDRLSYDADESVRQRVAAALGQLGDNVNTPALIRLLDDRPAVRRAALDALPKVVQTPFAIEPTDGSMTPEKLAELWKDWYRDQESGVLMR